MTQRSSFTLMWERVSQQRPFGWSELSVFLFEGQCDRSMAEGQRGGDGKESMGWLSPVGYGKEIGF